MGKSPQQRGNDVRATDPIEWPFITRHLLHDTIPPESHFHAFKLLATNQKCSKRDAIQRPLEHSLYPCLCGHSSSICIYVKCGGCQWRTGWKPQEGDPMNWIIGKPIQVLNRIFMKVFSLIAKFCVKWKKKISCRYLSFNTVVLIKSKFFIENCMFIKLFWFTYEFGRNLIRTYITTDL